MEAHHESTYDVIYKKGFFLGLFSFTSKCNLLSGKIMNARKSREKTKYKSFVTYSCMSSSYEDTFFFYTY